MHLEGNLQPRVNILSDGYSRLYDKIFIFNIYYFIIKNFDVILIINIMNLVMKIVIVID